MDASLEIQIKLSRFYLQMKNLFMHRNFLSFFQFFKHEDVATSNKYYSEETIVMMYGVKLILCTKEPGD